MYTASGLHVRFLKVFEKSNYQTVKWVRYVCSVSYFLAFFSDDCPILNFPLTSTYAGCFFIVFLIDYEGGPV